MKILAPAGTLATTRRLIERDRDAVARFMRAYVEAMHYFGTNREGSIRIMQKYMRGITSSQAGFLYDEQKDLLGPLPLPSEEAIQAVLDREADPKAKSFKPRDFMDLSFLREIEQSGFIKEPDKASGRPKP